MKVLVTGMIAGLDDRAYIEVVKQMAKLDHVHLDVFNLIDTLENSGEKKLHRLLGATNYQFELTRERDYGRIGMELMRSNSTHALIRVPSTLMWRGINLKMKDHKVIKETINPDVVVTLIDAEWAIETRLSTIGGGDGFTDQLLEDGCSCKDILSWMHEEVSIAEDWARYMGIPHYVIPIGQHPLSLYKLIKYEDVRSWYVSYSMTHADTTMRRQINDTIKHLCEYGLVIDPQCIELPKYKDFSESDMKAMYAYTVHRDLHWFVGKVKAVVAIHPYLDRPPLSTGMMDELGHARDYLLARYMIFPPEHVSPFTSNSYIEPHHIFHTGDEFFANIESKGFRKLKFRAGVVDVPWDANPLSGN